MEYVLTFLEGIISFISPCMLPMLPVYVTYFTGGATDKKRMIVRILSFIAGFTVIYILLGVFAGFLGSLLVRYRKIIDVVAGIVVVFFGLSYLEIIRIPFFKGVNGAKNATTAFSAFLFGVVYSVSLTPCTGPFLGSAIMLASSGGEAVKGALLLFCYSMGLGVPFAISAVMLDRLSGTFSFIKRHYKVINTSCGIFLVALGILMCFGFLTKFALFLSGGSV